MVLYTPTFRKALSAALTKKPFSARHAFFAVAFTSMFMALRVVVEIGRRLDPLLYPKYRQQDIGAPLYIIGNPRSGTTFTHRLIAHDERYTTFKLWQTIFPAVCFYRLFGAIGRVDNALGKPAQRLIGLAFGKGMSGWDDIHKTGLGKTESHEMLFMHIGLSPLMTLMFPYYDELREAIRVDDLDENTRARVRDYFVDCLKRHLYAEGGDKILLEKAALIAGRLDTVREALPRARFVQLVRHPYKSVPSHVSMFLKPWGTLAPQHAAPDGEAAGGIAQMTFDYYRIIHSMKGTFPPDRFMELYYDEVVADPKAAVERVYAHFKIPMTAQFEHALEAERERARSYVSKHAYSAEQYGLTKERIREELAEIFDEHGFEA
jgi:hypothetical protein